MTSPSDEPFRVAGELRKQGRYRDAIAIYAPLMEQQEAFTEWDGWNYALSLLKSEDAQTALDVCRSLYREYPGSELIKSLYARSIYDSEVVREPPGDLDVMRRTVEAILYLSPYDLHRPCVLTQNKPLIRRRTVIRRSPCGSHLFHDHVEKADTMYQETDISIKKIIQFRMAANFMKNQAKQLCAYERNSRILDNPFKNPYLRLKRVFMPRSLINIPQSNPQSIHLACN